MNIIESINDFHRLKVYLSETELFFEFNRLLKKETRLTTPSIICYIQTHKDEKYRLVVKTVTKCYLSLNPLEDIKKDSLLFDTFDEIFIHPNSEHNELYLNESIAVPTQDTKDNSATNRNIFFMRKSLN